ncbi:MAG: fasciclin domain-containing protein [Mycobacterium sp.]
MKTRTSKAFAATAGIAAIASSLPLAINAYADPPPEPVPVAEVPDPQGPGCDAFKQSVPNFKTLNNIPVGKALASIPDISTFNAAISGGFNPAVNTVPMLENGPYVVFAPTNEAFAELPPQQLDALKADPAALTKFDNYHVFLGLLGPDDVKGQRPTQEGTEIKVEGEGGDIKVNDTAKVLCGAIQASNARIYLIDKVLDPAAGPQPITPTGTSSTTTTTTTTTSETVTPGAEAPAG